MRYGDRWARRVAEVTRFALFMREMHDVEGVLDWVRFMCGRPTLSEHELREILLVTRPGRKLIPLLWEREYGTVVEPEGDNGHGWTAGYRR